MSMNTTSVLVPLLLYPDDDERPLIQSLWPYADLDHGEVQAEVEVAVWGRYKAESWHGPAEYPETEPTGRGWVYLDGAEYPLPEWVLGVLDHDELGEAALEDLASDRREPGDDL